MLNNTGSTADTSSSTDNEYFTNETTTLKHIPKNDSNSWISYIAYVVVPLLLVVGIFGHACVIIIMRSRHFRVTTTAVFLTALALSDTKFILLFPFTKSFTQELFGRDVRAITITGCKIFFCMYRSAKIFSSWLVVLICIERFIVIWFPLQAKTILTRRTAIFLVCSLLCVVYTFDGIWTITTSIVNGKCLPNFVTAENKALSSAFVVAGTVIYNVIPSLVLIFLTPLTIFKLLRHRSKRLEMMKNTNRSDETFRITRMLLAITVAYLILVTPISTAHSVAFFKGDNIFESKDKNFIIFREIAQIFEQLNYVINFFIYVIYNSTFRQHFYKLFSKQRLTVTQKAHQILESHTSGDHYTSSLQTDSSKTSHM